MEKKIVLSKEEKKVIKKYLEGKFSPFLCTDEERKAMTSVLDKAEALEEELDATDEVMATENCSVITWFWNKYNEQNEKSK